LNDPILPPDPFWDFEKALSLAIALVNVAGGYLAWGGEVAIPLVYSLFCLAFIWLAEPIGDVDRYSRRNMPSTYAVTRASPPQLIRALGWILIFVPAALIVVYLCLGHSPV
jgi:hypothetical protein